MIKNRYEFLQNILKKLEQYELETGIDESLDISDFAQWLFVETRKRSSQEISINERYTGLGELVNLMYRYAKLYTKKAMENTPLSSIDDFGYLINLWVYGAMTKTELIQRNIHEKPTGMEIIKRLLKQGFINQTNDPEDGRSHLVTITPEGTQLLLPLLSRMQRVETIAKGNLNEQETSTLLYLLRKLHVFHNNIYHSEKQLELETVFEKYIKTTHEIKD